MPKSPKVGAPRRRRPRAPRAAAAAPRTTVVVNNRRPARAAAKPRPPDRYARALIAPFVDGIGMKYPDLSCRSSATSWTLTTAAVTTDAAGAAAFCLNPAEAQLFTVSGTIAAGNITWGSAVAPANYTALSGSSSQYRCVSAAMMFIPSTSVTNATGLFTLSQTTLAPSGVTAVTSYVNAANAVYVPISDTWQAFWKPLDFESVNYKLWTSGPASTAPENNLVYTIAGAPVSTSIGRVVWIVNWEVIVDNASGSVLVPTPALCDMAQLQYAANVTGSMQFVTHMAYMTGAGTGSDSAGAARGDTVGGAATAGGWALSSVCGAAATAAIGVGSAMHLYHMSKRARHALSDLGSRRPYGW